jgi:hypothetical protein
MNLTEAKEVLKEHGYLLTEANYKYKLTLIFYTNKAASNFYLDKNEDYVCTDSSLGNTLFFWFNENDQVKKFINELIDNDNIEKFDLKRN